jgi:uncharacterized phage protein gp47/JayE
MSFDRPTLSSLVNRAVSDIETRLAGASARIKGVFEYALAYAVAGLAHGLHGHLYYLSKSFLPDSDVAETVYRWASILGVTPTPPAKAHGNVIVTGTDTTPIPAGTVWVRQDGEEFTTDAAASISGTSATIAVTATVAHDAGDTAAGTSLTIGTPIAGIDANALVDGSGLVDGADAESVTSLRSRILERLQTPPTGGGPGDYVRWAKEVTGVTRAWELPAQLGPGTVLVLVATDDEATPIPTSAKVTEVQNHIDGVAPVTADVTAAAPTGVALDVTVAITPDTAEIRAAVEAELASMVLRDGSAGGVTLYLSRIREAISIATGEENHVLTAPSANQVYAVGELPVLGTITFS